MSYMRRKTIKGKSKSKVKYVKKTNKRGRPPKNKPVTKPKIKPIKPEVKPILTPLVVPIVAPIKKEKAPSKSKMYFTQDTQDAIVAYNLEENMDKRNKIYEEKIKFALEKLVENIFNTFKFTYFEVGPLTTQQETLSHLVSNLNKFSADRGSKAYSYFSIVAKNFLIFHNNGNYKKFNRQVEIAEENEENTVCLQHTDKHHYSTEVTEFIKLMIDFWDNNITKIFIKDRDINIAQAVIEIFRNYDKIDIFNKKALYLYIREISSCKTQQITKVITKMKKYQNELKRTYVKDGTVKELA